MAGMTTLIRALSDPEWRETRNQQGQERHDKERSANTFDTLLSSSGHRTTLGRNSHVFRQAVRTTADTWFLELRDGQELAGHQQACRAEYTAPWTQRQFFRCSRRMLKSLLRGIIGLRFSSSPRRKKASSST